MNITRRFSFAAGHRLLGHEGGCKNMHGHNYVAEVEVVADALDEIGRVVDFSVVKGLVGGWIDSAWDHAFIYNDADHQVIAALAACPGKSFAMTCNPTAENMASLLLAAARQALAPMGLRVTRVTLHETENCRAEVES